MGFWKFLFGRNTQKNDDFFIDDFFGEMLFIESIKDANQNYFECRRVFGPSGKHIEIGIDGQLSGPTQQQKDFFEQLEKDYSLLITKLAPAIEERFGHWMKLPVIQNFEVEFTPTYLAIPTCDQQPVEWEISFDTVHDVNHIVTVGMLGNEPQYVQVDG